MNFPATPITATAILDTVTATFGLWVSDTVCKWLQTNFTVTMTCPPDGPFIPVMELRPVPYSTSPFLTSYFLGYGPAGVPLTATSGGFKITVTAPFGSTHWNKVYTANTTVVIDAPGRYSFDLSFNDGCGPDYTLHGLYGPFDHDCPFASSFPFALQQTPSASLGDITWDDKNSVRLEVVNFNPAAPYDKSAFTPHWTIKSAPADSIYLPYPGVVESYGSDIAVTNFSWTSGNDTFYRKTTTVTDRFRVFTRSVILDVLTDNTLSLYPTCFRPDVPGAYVATCTMQLLSTRCYYPVDTAIMNVKCPNTPPVLDSIVPMEVPVDREQPTRVWLNASAVALTSSLPLTYTWKLLYPTNMTRNPIDGVNYTLPAIVSYRSMVSSFWVPQANVDYVIELSVSDSCNTVVKNFTVKTPCNLRIPLDNKTLAAYYNGEVPVTLMSFAYDHTQEVGNVFTYPKCQKYEWKLVDYSTAYSDALLGSASTDFVKTSGFRV